MSKKGWWLESGQKEQQRSSSLGPAGEYADSGNCVKRWQGHPGQLVSVSRTRKRVREEGEEKERKRKERKISGKDWVWGTEIMKCSKKKKGVLYRHV